MSVADPQLRIVQLERELQWAQLKIQVLEERLRQRRIHLLGPHSETLSNLQLELLTDEEPGVTAGEVKAEAKREAITKAPGRERKPHPGRERLPENLPRVERVIRCEDKLCAACGRETAVIGHDESEQLDVEPARYFVRVTKREKRACHSCQQGTVTMAPLEPRIVAKGLASDAVVIDIVVAKYCDHLPLYRQAAMLERETGLEISRATLNGWVMRVGELLQPVVQAMRKDLLTTTYLQADETTVPVQMHDGRGSNHQATYGNTASLVARRCSTFAWGAVARVHSSFWANGKAFCKPTATRLMTAWADRNWCTSVVGGTHGASLWTR